MYTEIWSVCGYIQSSKLFQVKLVGRIITVGPSSQNSGQALFVKTNYRCGRHDLLPKTGHSNLKVKSVFECSPRILRIMRVKPRSHIMSEKRLSTKKLTILNVTLPSV